MVSSDLALDAGRQPRETKSEPPVWWTTEPEEVQIELN
jgi:hypothetical protein